MVLLIILIVGGIAFAAFFKHAMGEHEKAEALKAAKVHSLAAIPGFEPAAVYEGQHDGYGIAIDPASDQFAIAILGHPARLYHFSQLVAVEVERDGETVTTTNGRINATGAAVATALAGPIGMALGAKTSSTSVSTNNVSKLALKLYVNDLHTPCFTVIFFASLSGFPPSNPLIQKASAELDAWHGRFRTVMAGLDRNDGAIDATKLVQHAGPAPQPVALSWTARTFGS